MTRKETALDALNKKIPKLEEKINQDKQLLEELKAKREMLEVEALKKFLHDNGMTTEEIIAKLTASSVVHEQKIVMEDRKMWNTKKSVAAVFSAMALTLASVGNAIPVFAEETAAITEMADDSSAANMELDEEDMQKLVDEIQHNKAAMENSDDETDNTGHDYYADENYDTDGNATLIKHEKIIYDSEEMQFIAVTTKDGNVFYILINYSAEGDEDNVFFLNKVDDFDLYSLLYAGNEGEEEKDPAEQAKKYADAATNGGVTADVSERAEEVTGETKSAEEKSTTKQPSSMNSNALILVGVGVLAVIGGAVLLLKKGKFGKKKNTGAEDFEEDYDDDYGSVTDEDEES